MHVFFSFVNNPQRLQQNCQQRYNNYLLSESTRRKNIGSRQNFFARFVPKKNDLPDHDGLYCSDTEPHNVADMSLHKALARAWPRHALPTPTCCTKGRPDGNKWATKNRTKSLSEIAYSENEERSAQIREK